MISVEKAEITIKTLRINGSKMTKIFFNQIQERDIFWWDEDDKLRWDWEDKEIIGWVNCNGFYIVFNCCGEIARKTLWGE